MNPIQLGRYESLTVQKLPVLDHHADPNKMVEDSPDKWDILAFSAVGENTGLVLLGRRKRGASVALDGGKDRRGSERRSGTDRRYDGADK
jgi:hypothetical protein